MAFLPRNGLSAAIFGLTASGAACLVGFFLTLTIPARAQKSPKLAVLEMAGTRLSKEVSGGLLDVLVSEVAQEGSYTVISPEDVLMALFDLRRRAKFNPDCDVTQCLVEIGGALGADLVMSGRVSRIGRKWVVRIHVAQVRTVGSTVREISGEEDVLIDGVRDAARELLGGRSSPSAPPVAGLGDLIVRTDPPGAEVTVDGRRVPGLTPLTLQEISVGEHKVHARVGNLVGMESVEVKTGEIAMAAPQMQLGQSSLLVRTDPEGAEVNVDGNPAGPSPAGVENLAWGNHTILVTRERYLDGGVTVAVSTEGVREVRIPLLRAALLTVESEPRGAEASLGGRVLGKTPLTRLSLAPGAATLSLTFPEYRAEQRKVTMRAGEEELIRADLKPLFGLVEVATDPPGADVRLGEVDLPMKTPCTLKVPPGEATITVSMVDRIDASARVQLIAGERTRVERRLAYTQGYIDGRLTIRQRLGTAGWSGLGVGVAAAAAALYFRIG